MEQVSDMPEVDEPMEMKVRREDSSRPQPLRPPTPKNVLLERAESFEREAARMDDQAAFLQGELADARRGAQDRREAAAELRRAAKAFD